MHQLKLNSLSNVFYVERPVAASNHNTLLLFVPHAVNINKISFILPFSEFAVNIFKTQRLSILLFSNKFTFVHNENVCSSQTFRFIHSRKPSGNVLRGRSANKSITDTLGLTYSYTCRVDRMHKHSDLTFTCRHEKIHVNFARLTSFTFSRFRLKSLVGRRTCRGV